MLSIASAANTYASDVRDNVDNDGVGDAEPIVEIIQGNLSAHTASSATVAASHSARNGGAESD